MANQERRERRPLLSVGSNESWNGNVQSASRSHSACSVRVAAGAILICVVLERVAFYGITGNLVLFLNKSPYEWESYHAMNITFFFFGVTYITSLLGGWLADSTLGRFKTIVLSLTVYIAGYVMLPLLSSYRKYGNTVYVPSICHYHYANDTNSTPIGPTLMPISKTNNGTDSNINPFDERCAWLIFIVLFVIGIGTGSVKANMAPFGVDQVTEEGQQATLGFFNWYYWCVNLGAFISLLIITWVQQQVSFFKGFLAASTSLAAGGCVFLFGAFVFIKRPPSGSILTNIFRIIREACRNKRRQKSRRYNSGSIDDISHIPHIDEAGSSNIPGTFLDNAKHRYGGAFHDSLVEDVKELKKILCVFAVLIPYWMVYFQMQTTFLVQGLHMKLIFNANISTSDRNTTTEKPVLVPAWFSVFDVIVLIVLLPLFDRVIYPRLSKAGHPFSMTKRIGLGMFFAIAAMVAAGVVEHFRLEAFWPNASSPCVNASIIQHIGGSDYEAANMSILWQIPQYILIGISEVFTSVAGLQFACSMSPRSMKGVIMGLFYFFSGIGSFLGTAVIITLNRFGIWFHAFDYGNISCRLNCNEGKYSNSCHLDYYFYFLACVEAVGLLLFILVSRVFHLQTKQQNNLQTKSHRHSASPIASNRSGLMAGLN